MLPVEALELFPDYDSQDPNSAIEISRRVEEFRLAHIQESYWRYRKGRFAIPIVDKHPRYREIMEKSDKRTRFLDLGCGHGVDIRKVIYDGLKKENVKGIDINSTLIERGFELYDDKETMKDCFDVGDALSTKYEDNSFNIIFSGSVIHVLKKKIEAIKYFKEAYRLLSKPTGILFGRTLGENKEQETEYLYITTPEKLREYLTSTEFNDIDIQIEERTKEKKYEPKFMLYFFART